LSDDLPSLPPDAALPTLGKINSRWLKFGEHRGLRKQVLESFRLKDTIRAIESTGYNPKGGPKESVDQDSTFQGDGSVST